MKQIYRRLLILAVVLGMSGSAQSQNFGSVRVPDVTGLPSAAQRNDALRSLGLNPVHASAGQPPSNDLSYKVARQSPAPGTVVARGSTVTILIYDKYAPVQYSAKLPDVVGMPWEQAIAALRGAGFEVRDARNIGKAPSPERAGRVASQVPGAGQDAPADRAVTLTWYDRYEGPNRAAPAQTTVPSDADSFVGEWIGKADVVPRAYNSSDPAFALGLGKFPGETTMEIVIRVVRNPDATVTVAIDSPGNPLVHLNLTASPTFRNGSMGLVKTLSRAGGTPDNFTVNLIPRNGHLICNWHLPEVTEPANPGRHNEHFQQGRFDGVRK